MPESSPTMAAPAQQRLELATIFARHGASYVERHRVPLHHLRVMQQIVACRTPALGGQRRWCDGCGYERFVYHSCRNRHCPKCQTQVSQAWREARGSELLPAPYFHQVFTLPHELNPWVLASERNRRALLKLLFDAASATLFEFGRTELRGQIGFTLVLHTWDQQLRPHFHLHAVIPAGALAENGSRWIAGGRQFLFPVRALSKMFRGKFLAGFSKLLAEDALDVPVNFRIRQRTLLRQLTRKSWVVYSKAPFAGPEKLLDYLSRYTHRVAISNHRLLACDDGQVTFTYRDRTDGDRRKRMMLPADEFIGRFLAHVLPKGFTRIRHYGFLANRHKQNKLARIRQLLGAHAPQPQSQQTLGQWLQAVLGIDPALCPCCGGPLLEETLLPAPRENVLLRQLLPAPPAPLTQARAPPAKVTP